MNDDTVFTEIKNGYMTITLNRPDKLNSFNEAQHIALKAALDAAEDDPSVRAVLLTGSGRGFCAGQDLGDRDPRDSEEAYDLSITIDKFYNPLIRRIRSLSKPVICAVNGVAAGAGANIAFACDIVLAAKSAKFIQAFCKIGLVPDSGGTWTVTKLIGEARAKYLMMTGAPVSAEQAADWGLIWTAVDDETLMDEAHKLAESFTNAPTFGLALTKQAIHASATNTLDEQLDLERDFQKKAGASDDYREGVGAFLEKRAPNFTGKAVE